ncbi:hypothetical protein RE428_44260 [Marinobacter nanhaiticus D15-8W]|uniref:Uncharacterized protein n=1 Tax=Marinobacter nanhaiticus D15-8W TaxID=626887 RepID=A0A371CGB6_9GAMM|nr:hypothetical protein J057_24275 [Marinobacter nanhaiticus D15-8W]BES73408.1 hypothetical protein RE428_44260 [Marinobacter nanhaiticus D15-8W]
MEAFVGPVELRYSWLCPFTLFSTDFFISENEKPRWLAADRGFSSPVAAWVSAGPPSESGEGVYAWPDLWLK